jgi:hypothetical protein
MEAISDLPMHNDIDADDPVPAVTHAGDFNPYHVTWDAERAYAKARG